MIEIEPESLKAYFRMAQACNCLQEYDDALEYVNKALEIGGDNKTIKKLKDKIVKASKVHKRKEKQAFGNIFKEEIYAGVDLSKPTMVKCTICNEEVEQIQLARHTIKKHTSKPGE